MTVETNTQFPTFDAAEHYIESVRDHYRHDHASYAGRRNEDQQAIAELASEEARLIADGVVAGYLAASSLIVPNEGMPKDYEETEVAGHKWTDFRGEFERLLVGFGVITNRLHRDGYKVPDFIELDDESRSRVAMQLFSDYLEHNGLRFGVDGSGVKRSYYKHTDDGYVEREIRDKDKAKNDRDLLRNMRERGYAAGIATHQAGKISPDAYRQLRKEFPEIDKDTFDQAVSQYRSVAEELASRGQ